MPVVRHVRWRKPFPVVHLDTDALEGDPLLVDRSRCWVGRRRPRGAAVFILPGRRSALRIAGTTSRRTGPRLGVQRKRCGSSVRKPALTNRAGAHAVDRSSAAWRASAHRRPDATLIEVRGRVMAEQHSRSWRWSTKGNVIGVITVHRLLGAALPA